MKSRLNPFAAAHITTNVKIIVAPTGMPAMYEIAYPDPVPAKPARIEKTTILGYDLVKSIAMLGGTVSSEITRTTPAILMFKTIVSAISDVVIYLKSSTYDQYVLANSSSNEM
jgi:hypothetical protein